RSGCRNIASSERRQLNIHWFMQPWKSWMRQWWMSTTDLERQRVPRPGRPAILANPQTTRSSDLMFEGLGSIASLITQLPKLKSEMEKLKQRLDQVIVEGTAGGGMVQVRVSGTLQLLDCKLSDEALRSGDKELLEDLIKAAVNQGMEKARNQA